MSSASASSRYDAVVVGAGLSGLYLLHRLRELGLSALVLEQASGVGGTWFWNRYPGARCDIESMTYSYSWSHELRAGVDVDRALRRPAGDPPLPRARRRPLRPAPRHPLLDARRGGGVRRGARSLVGHDRRRRRGSPPRFLIMATGCLSVPRVPDIPGMERFAGELHHTGVWPHGGVDVAGKRVGVIGTGSSAVQAIPVIAEEAAQLTVFQRTANFSVPAWNGPLDAEAIGERKARYDVYRRKARTTTAREPVELARAERVGRDARGARARVRGALRRRRVLPPRGVLRPVLRSRRERARVRVPAQQDPRARARPGARRAAVPGRPSARDEADVRRHGLLRDVTTAPTSVSSRSARRRSRRSPRPGCASPARSSRSTRSCSRTGFDAMTGALLAIDLRGRGRPVAAREVGGRAALVARPRRSPASRTCSPSPAPAARPCSAT